MNILLFGGTTEGRQLATALAQAGHQVVLSVATPLGQELSPQSQVTVQVKRLDQAGMIQLIEERLIEAVIDASHPYATVVTEQARQACQITGRKYYRLTRPKLEYGDDVLVVPDAKVAAEWLDEHPGNALLTIGSKALADFTQVSDYQTRLYIRILAMETSLKHALDLGFRGSHIIAMPGPFSVAMNLATLELAQAKYLVTKDSGEIGGVEAKLVAARQAGVQVIVIARPTEESGFTLTELLSEFSLPLDQAVTRFFPVFLDLSNKRVVVVGGGQVASRRVKQLLEFGAQLVVISPKITPEITDLALTKQLIWLERSYQAGDVTTFQPDFVITATNQRTVNQAVTQEANQLNIPISVADCRRDCSWYFPAIVETDDLVGGFVSKRGHHQALRQVAADLRKYLNHEENHSHR